MMMKRWLGVFAPALGALALAPPASASCIPLPPLARALASADTVFVGTALEVTNHGRTATFRVEEVWKGDVAETVVVYGGQEGANVFSSVDRTYRAGKRYLVIPYRSERDAFWDNSCSSTREYASGLDHLRPGSPAQPEVRDQAARDRLGGWLQVGLASGLGAAIALLVLRRFGRVRER
jgi:hypothetical protein